MLTAARVDACRSPAIPRQTSDAIPPRRRDPRKVRNPFTQDLGKGFAR